MILLACAQTASCDKNRDAKNISREKERERDGPHAAQLPQGPGAAKQVAVVPLEGAGSSFFLFLGE